MPARPLRRLVAVIVCSACLLLPQAASPVPGSEATRGERGSGPPTWSAVVDVTPPDASVQIDLPQRWKLVLSGDNLTNSAGLTEGNPRTDLSGDPPGAFYMARPLFGRSFMGSVTYRY